MMSDRRIRLISFFNAHLREIREMLYQNDNDDVSTPARSPSPSARNRPRMRRALSDPPVVPVTGSGMIVVALVDAGMLGLEGSGLARPGCRRPRRRHLWSGDQPARGQLGVRGGMSLAIAGTVLCVRSRFPTVRRARIPTPRVTVSRTAPQLPHSTPPAWELTRLPHTGGRSRSRWGSCRHVSSCLVCEEVEECRVDLVGMCPADVVRAFLDGNQRDVRDEFSEARRGRVVRRHAGGRGFESRRFRSRFPCAALSERGRCPDGAPDECVGKASSQTMHGLIETVARMVSAVMSLG